MKRGNIGRVLRVFFAVLLVCLGLSFCRKKTEEDLILETVDRIIRLAEKKDIGAVMTYFAADFSDFEGRDREGLRSLFSEYVSGRAGIVVHRLSSRVNSLESDRASLQTEVALSSGRAAAVRRLIRVSPDNYRITVELAKAGDRWLIRFAEWSYVNLDELFPEWLAIFNKIFSR
jgi:hypothetical protein